MYRHHLTAYLYCPLPVLSGPAFESSFGWYASASLLGFRTHTPLGREQYIGYRAAKVLSPRPPPCLAARGLSLHHPPFISLLAVLQDVIDILLEWVS